MPKAKVSATARLVHPLGRSLTAADYRQRGWKSSAEAGPGQHTFDLQGSPELDASSRSQPLKRWEDMHPEEQRKVADHLQANYGITMRNAIHNHGVLIDKGFLAAGDHAEAFGQRFYRGGDDNQLAHREITAMVAKKHDLPVHVVAAMRASVSPRNNVDKELEHVEAAIAHVKGNPGSTYNPKLPSKAIDHPDFIRGIGGLAGQRGAQKAAEILRQHGQGIHPLDATDPRTDKKTRNKGVPDRLLDERGNPKVNRYLQSYTHPDEADTAIDTHAVGGMAPHLPKQAPKVMNAKGFEQPVPESHPDWHANQEDSLNRAGAYQFFDYAARTAAKKRGLTSSEAQSIAWHQERYERQGRTDIGGAEEAPKGFRVKQPEMTAAATPAQVSKSQAGKPRTRVTQTHGPAEQTSSGPGIQPVHREVEQLGLFNDRRN
jgi:hypothetical protein